MSYSEILYERRDRTALITLNRPKRMNAFTYTMGDELQQALREADADPEIRASVVTGAGRAFCAGADLGGGGDTFKGSTEDRERSREAARRSDAPRSTAEFYFQLKKPVIVAYNGAAIGVGVTLTLPMDIRIAAESAKVGIVFNRRGVIPEVACPWILPRIVGISRAAELMYTGRILTAAEALEFGLVSRVVPDAELLPTALGLAGEIADNCAPVSVALTKKMLYEFLEVPSVAEAERINHRYFGWVARQQDAREGVVSFLEKRPPDWKLKLPDDMPDF